jgi:cis-3-alkyl-4-acyloxetan-2-one decarboxylase
VDWVELPADVKRHYPWPGARLTLSTGHSLHYLDEGEGEPLLMVHGNPTWSFYWRTLVQGLSDRFRCVVPDHLGAGLSDMPEDYPYRLDDHIRNLVELIDHLDLRGVTLMVHDWGGPTGFGAAVERPDRIARVVVFNTAVFHGPVPLSIRACRLPLVGDVLVRGLNGFARAAMIRATADRARFRDGVAAGYLAPYGGWAHRVGHLGFVRDIPIEANHPTRAWIDRLTKEVPERFGDRPAQIYWGAQDFVFTDWFLDRWRGLLPQAEVTRYADVGHWVVEDAHERILPKLRGFLGA